MKKRLWLTATILTVWLNIDAKEGTMVQPERLFPESIKTVGIISPACLVSPRQLKTGIDFLKSHGLKVKVGSASTAKIPVENLTRAPVADRVRELEEMWMDPEIDLLIPVRGGIGSEDLLKHLNWEKLRSRRMKLIGFSDISALEAGMIFQKAGHPYSGPNPSVLIRLDRSSAEHMRNVLAGKKNASFKLTVLRSGACRGGVYAGNLVCTAFALRLGFMPDTSGKIIFWEHIGFTPEKTTEMLNLFKQSGVFEKCAGVVFGQLTFNTPELRAQAKRRIEEFSRNLKCPVYMNYPYGHEQPMLTIDQESLADIDESGILCFEPPSGIVATVR